MIAFDRLLAVALFCTVLLQQQDMFVLSTVVVTYLLLMCRDSDTIDGLDRYAMACPALPLCGLAIGEAERGLPDINNRIRALMNKLGFAPDEHFHIRMTGCPNGCTRPYMAELGFVGDGPNSYQLWLGGTATQTRLAEPFMERMKVQVRTLSLGIL